jgi:hypothetical protein
MSFVCKAVNLPKFERLANIVRNMPESPLTGKELIMVEIMINLHVPKKEERNEVTATVIKSIGKNIKRYRSITRMKSMVITMELF